jgi:3-isopropylmalate dehydrogenase
VAKILVLPGDGIGVEVTEASIGILKVIGEKYGIEFEFETALFGRTKMG